MPHAQPVALLILTLWLCLLFSTIGIAASDFFCPNLSTISQLLGLSESLAGVTFLAFGNGSPDVFSTFAAFSTNSGSLAVGELIGAAGFITAVVAGSMAITRPFKVAKRSFVRDVVFFTIAAGFSMVFLYDGKLQLWECCVMVGFYLFYVVVVVAWHWWLTRRRRLRLKEAAARAHYVVPGYEVADTEGRYHDDEEGNETITGRSGSISQADFNTLERGNNESSDADEEDEAEEAERELGQWKNQMRLGLRPQLGLRQPTQVSIRPSLVGALEFRAVLAGLQKARNIQTMPLYLRRYSDESAYNIGRDADRLSTVSDPSIRLSRDFGVEGDPNLLMPSRPEPDGRTASGNRARAVSAGDAYHLQFDPAALPTVDLLGPLSEDDQSFKAPRPGGGRPISPGPPSPTISISPLHSEQHSRASTPAPQHSRQPSGNLLAPPSPNLLVPGDSGESHRIPNIARSLSSRASSRSQSPERHLPQLVIPSGSRHDPNGSIPFPPYTDYPSSTATSPRAASIRRIPSVSAGSYPHDLMMGQPPTRPLRWWPYKLLPSPEDLFSTLFPTLWSWKSKSIWEKALGIVSAPSVLLLTITLPVIETELTVAGHQDTGHSFSLPPPLLSNGSMDGYRPHGQSFITIIEPSSPTQSSDEAHQNENGANKSNHGIAGHENVASVALAAEERHQHMHRPYTQILSPSTHPNPQILESPEQLPADHPINTDNSSNGWNRWLIMLQTVTAPFFIVLILWANMEADSPSSLHILFRWTLYGLLSSCITLALIMGTTTPSRPPKWHTFICFLGFAVSIAWISTIANEVVGVLKALGVILNISDAILGLTIFAVGNSLGDLVADITVARLGRPVMALSACFGGPMLNILLGIGVSGLYMTIIGAKHRYEKHPDQGMHYKPYVIKVSRTLVVSGATLLVTLVGLLFAVPMRKWRMDRWIGTGLIVLWVCSTIGNVVLELTGYGGSEM